MKYEISYNLFKYNVGWYGKNRKNFNISIIIYNFTYNDRGDQCLNFCHN